MRGGQPSVSVPLNGGSDRFRIPWGLGICTEGDYPPIPEMYPRAQVYASRPPVTDHDHRTDEHAHHLLFLGPMLQ